MAENAEGWFMVTVDDIVNNDNLSQEIACVHLMYCYHTIPNYETNKMIKMGQLTVNLDSLTRNWQ